MQLIGGVTRAAIIGALSLAISACATLDTVKNAPLGEGKHQAFSASYDHTTAATLKALSSLNIDIANSNEDAAGTTYLVSKPMSPFSWGEVGRVWVKKSDAPPTSVYVNWEKRAEGQWTGTSQDEFSDALFKAIANAL